MAERRLPGGQRSVGDHEASLHRVNCHWDHSLPVVYVNRRLGGQRKPPVDGEGRHEMINKHHPSCFRLCSYSFWCFLPCREVCTISSGRRRLFEVRPREIDARQPLFTSNVDSRGNSCCRGCKMDPERCEASARSDPTSPVGANACKMAFASRSKSVPLPMLLCYHRLQVCL